MSVREFTCEDCGELIASFEPAADGDVCLVCKFIREQPENERASMRELLRQPCRYTGDIG